jgi:two-component sensor histidine kinase
LRKVVLQELEPYGFEDRARFVIEGPDFELRPKTAVALGMALHELATNAAKYGALSKPTGQVRVTWELLRSSEPSAIRLRWLETGGPPVQGTQRKGFGSTVIERGLALELDAKVEIDFDPKGLICDIEIPLGDAPAGARNRERA